MALLKPLSLRLVLLVYLFRFLNALLAITFFQPDEFYQSIEIAHKLVFGFGYTTWEWRPAPDLSTGGIRSPLYPAIFVPAYWLLNLLRLDHTQLLIIAPKFIQAGIASVTDLATYSLAARFLSPAYAPAALACSLTSFFNAYAGVRTFSNSAETALTACALVFWPWTGDRVSDSWSELAMSIVFITLSIIVRPSSVLFWALLALTLLRNSRGEARMDVLALFAVMGVVGALACFLIDSSFYGLSTFTPLNFFRQNVSNSVASFYGVNRWHFYFSQAFAFVNWSLFPTVLLGMFLFPIVRPVHEAPAQLVRLRAARTAVLGTMVGLSFVRHKEFRFIHPLVPLFNCFAARAMVNNYTKSHPSSPPGRLERLLRARPIGFFVRTVIAMGAAAYLLTVHYRAQVSVMSYLRQLPDEELKSVGFLMPCHSTPWQSHLHKHHLAPNGTEERMWMLTCEPPLGLAQHANSSTGQNLTESDSEEGRSANVSDAQLSGGPPWASNLNSTAYMDEADEFYLDPVGFLTARFPATVDQTFPATNKATLYAWPSHLVMFEVLWKDREVREVVEKKGYKVVWEEVNGRWHDDEKRRGGKVLVLNWKN